MPVVLLFGLEMAQNSMRSAGHVKKLITFEDDYARIHKPALILLKDLKPGQLC